ncbi:MAG: arabinan endo-1,5-alpha-L-arabinosidase [Prolixibacteraceae bacterium]
MRKLLMALFLIHSIYPVFSQNGNIVEGQVRVHDPVMIEENGHYYIFCTGRGISILSSNDMIHWERAGSVFSNEDLPAWHQADIPEQKGHLWAPDIHYRNGKYHLYYSVSAWMNFNSSIGYATNVTLDQNDPKYQWVDEGKVIDFRNGGEGVNVIDPNIYVADDGKVWLFYGSYQKGLRLVELSPETGHPLSETPELTVITPSLGEGVYVLKSGEYYYIFASRGICCKGNDSNYQVVTGRSKTLKGPYLNKLGESWTDNHYSLFMAGDYERPGRGHNGFFTQNDTTYIVYHAYTRSADGQSLLNIQPVYQSEDGWPCLEQTDELFDVNGFD